MGPEESNGIVCRAFCRDVTKISIWLLQPNTSTIDGLEIRSNLNKFGKNMAKPSSALLERSFSVLSHLHCQQKSSYMKIQGDGSLIDIDVSLLEPDTE